MCCLTFYIIGSYHAWPGSLVLGHPRTNLKIKRMGLKHVRTFFGSFKCNYFNMFGSVNFLFFSLLCQLFLQNKKCFEIFEAIAFTYMCSIRDALSNAPIMHPLC